MKLLWVFSTFAIGGPQRRAALIVDKLGDGHDHLIAALDNRWEAESFLSAGARWKKLPLDFRKSSLVSPANLALIRKTLRESAPDLLLTSNWGSIEWAIANRGRGRVPHIHFEDGFGSDESPSRQNPKRAFVRRLALADRPVVVPSATLREVATKRWGLPERNVHFIPNGIDVARYDRPHRRGSVIAVGSIGALRGEKNYARLTRAVAQAARASGPVQLLIYGEGDQRGAIEREAAAQAFVGLSLPGATTAPEEALAGLDIFALSSDTEQMPLSLMEAMAAGLPVAATDVGDIARMVSAKNRPYVTPLGDDAALARTIATLASSPELRRDLGTANREKARAEFGVDKMVAAHFDLYRRTARTRDA